MTRITREPGGEFRIRATAADIETPWNRCPQVYYAVEDWLNDYAFGQGRGDVIWGNQPDNRHRSWWQVSQALGVIREICKNQDQSYMGEKLDKFGEQVGDMVRRYPGDREEFMALTDKDRNVFGTFNAMSELHVEPLFDGVDHEPTRRALRECIAWAKAIGTVARPEELAGPHRRCRVAVEDLTREGRRR